MPVIDNALQEDAQTALIVDLKCVRGALGAAKHSKERPVPSGNALGNALGHSMEHPVEEFGRINVVCLESVTLPIAVFRVDEGSERVLHVIAVEGGIHATVQHSVVEQIARKGQIHGDVFHAARLVE